MEAGSAVTEVEETVEDLVEEMAGALAGVAATMASAPRGAVPTACQQDIRGLGSCQRGRLNGMDSARHERWKVHSWN